MQKVSSSYTKDVNPIGFLIGSNVLYADKKKTTSLLRTIGFRSPIELNDSGFVSSISYNKQNVKFNGKPFSEVVSEKNNLYSDRDSAGNELSKGQQDFFAESKIRDKEGNLQVMYHGSPETFTVFDKNKAKYGGLYGRGFYFTNSSSHASQYGSNYEVYLNIKIL